MHTPGRTPAGPTGWKLCATFPSRLRCGLDFNHPVLRVPQPKAGEMSKHSEPLCTAAIRMCENGEAHAGPAAAPQGAGYFFVCFFPATSSVGMSFGAAKSTNRRVSDPSA